MAKPGCDCNNLTAPFVSRGICAGANGASLKAIDPKKPAFLLPALVLGLMATIFDGCISGRSAASTVNTGYASNRNVPPADCTTIEYYYAGLRIPYRSKPEWLFVIADPQRRLLFNRLLDSLALREVRDGELLAWQRDSLNLINSQSPNSVRDEGGIYLARKDGLPFSRNNCHELAALRSCPYVQFAGPTIISRPDYVFAYRDDLYIKFFTIPDSATLAAFLHRYRLIALPVDGAIPRVTNSSITVLAPAEVGEGLSDLAYQINCDANVSYISYDYIESSTFP